MSDKIQAKVKGIDLLGHTAQVQDSDTVNAKLKDKPNSNHVAYPSRQSPTSVTGSVSVNNATTIEDSLNVDGSLLADGSMLVYKETTQKWKTTTQLSKQSIEGGEY